MSISTELKITEFSNTCFTSIDEIKHKTTSIKESITNNINTVKNCKVNFKNKYSNLIDILQELISQNEEDFLDEEESPASMINKTLPNFPNGTTSYTHERTEFWTFSCKEPLDDCFEFKLKIIKSNPGYLCVGFSETILDDTSSYLGGRSKKGEWGLASNASMGVNGTWSSGGKSFNTGDIITLKGDSGLVTLAVNDEWIGCKTQMNTPLYLSFTFYYSGDAIEIMD